MTRKDFEALALALKTNNASLDLCASVACICAKKNPRFDTERFLVACGFNFKEGMML